MDEYKINCVLMYRLWGKPCFYRGITIKNGRSKYSKRCNIWALQL